MTEKTSNNMKTFGNDIELLIRKACPEDSVFIIDFLNLVGKESNFLSFGAQGFHLNAEEEYEIISDCIKLDLNLMLIAKIDHNIVGHLFLQRSKVERIKHVGELSLSVLKQYWGNSIGLRMIYDAIEWAKQKEIAKLQLQVRCDNERAINLYKKIGFMEEGIIRRAIKVDNVYFDEYLMGLCL
jgi:RimJ/RimL family protein N-acetyltransferase